MTRKIFSILALFNLLSGQDLLRSADLDAVLEKWLAAQTNFQTWSADFVQTRTLKTLTQPLTSDGHVWFAAPNQFRWELGHPPQTIAVRQKDEMLVIYPKLKRAERYPLNQQMGQWRDALALLEAGFPRDRADLEARFKIASLDETDNFHRLTLQPKSSQAKKILAEVKIEIAKDNFSLHATELKFGDGSTMRNDFKNAVANPKLDEALFHPKLEANIKIVEPLKKGTP